MVGQIRWQLVGKLGAIALGGGLALTACQSTLDTEKITADIQVDLKDKGNLPVKSVICPQTVTQKAESAFVCVVELDGDTRFNLTVRQTDDKGTVAWDVENSKAVLNLTKLQTEFQTAIQRQTGVAPDVDCGGAYRINKPGETFECKTLTRNKPGAIFVRVDPVGNVSWNEIIDKPVAKPAKSTTTASKPEATPVADGTEPTATEPEAAPAAPSGQTADDFLNQPGALDNLED